MLNLDGIWREYRRRRNAAGAKDPYDDLNEVMAEEIDRGLHGFQDGASLTTPKGDHDA